MPREQWWLLESVACAQRSHLPLEAMASSPQTQLWAALLGLCDALIMVRC